MLHNCFMVPLVVIWSWYSEQKIVSHIVLRVIRTATPRARPAANAASEPLRISASGNPGQSTPRLDCQAFRLETRNNVKRDVRPGTSRNRFYGQESGIAYNEYKYCAWRPASSVTHRTRPGYMTIPSHWPGESEGKIAHDTVICNRWSNMTVRDEGAVTIRTLLQAN